KRAAAGDRGSSGGRSQTDSEDEAHLIISFAFGAGGLGEGGNSGEPAITAIRNVWTNEEIVLGFGAVPGRQKNLVQHFRAHGNSRAQFVAGAESLLDLTVMFAQIFIFPSRFQGEVISENEGAEILLQNQFRF